MDSKTIDEEYLKGSAELKLELSNAEKEQEKYKSVDLSSLKEILESDFRSLYETFNEEEKQHFWLGLIDKIIIEDKKIKRVCFIH